MHFLIVLCLSMHTKQDTCGFVHISGYLRVYSALGSFVEEPEEKRAWTGDIGLKRDLWCNYPA